MSDFELHGEFDDMKIQVTDRNEMLIIDVMRASKPWESESIKLTWDEVSKLIFGLEWLLYNHSQ